MINEKVEEHWQFFKAAIIEQSKKELITEKYK